MTDTMEGRLAEWRAAWDAAVQLLADGEWHPWQTVVSTMYEAAEVRERDCNRMLAVALRKPKDIARKPGEPFLIRLTEHGRRFLTTDSE